MSVGNTGFKEFIFGVLFPKFNIITAITTASTVHFKVSLIHYIDAKGITEHIKLRAVRIMRRSDRIDIEFLHKMNVSRQFFKADGRCCLAVKIVSVNAFQFYRLTIDLKYFAVNGDLSETDAFDNFFIVCIKFEGIKFRAFCCPSLYLRNDHLCFHLCRNDDAVLLQY